MKLPAAIARYVRESRVPRIIHQDDRA